MLLWMIGLALLAFNLTAGEPPTRLLTESELSMAAKGAAPEPNCTHGLWTVPCTDWLIRCYNNPTCAGACSSCNNPMNQDEECRNGKPLTVLNCVQQPAEPGGCGKQMVDTTCQMVMNQCKCTGGMATELNCSRKRATYLSAPVCTVVLP
jgi:hypothetical protein